jgi:hypothetical protein
MEEASRAPGSVGLSYGAHSNLCINQLKLSLKGENCRENPLTIFVHIRFYPVGNGNRKVIGNENGKVRNRIRSVKFGPSKMDKSEQKCLGIDRQTVI